jgi:hypothetical protein
MLPGVHPTGGLANGAALAAVAAATAGTAERLWLLSPRDSDRASLSASSAVTTLPVSNLQSRDPRKVWRSAGLTERVTVTLAEPLACTAAAANGVNFTGGAVWRALGAATLAGLDSDPEIDTGWRSFFPLGAKPLDRDWLRHGSLLRWDNDGAFRYWALEFGDPGNADGYLDIGRLALGRDFQPSQNPDFSGEHYAFDQRDVQAITPYGDMHTDRREKSARRRMVLNIPALDQAEAFDRAGEIRRLAGLWGDVFVCLDPAATTDFHRQFMQAVFVQPQGHSLVPWFNPNGGMATVTLPLREV